MSRHLKAVFVIIASLFVFSVIQWVQYFRWEDSVTNDTKLKIPQISISIDDDHEDESTHSTHSNLSTTYFDTLKYRRLHLDSDCDHDANKTRSIYQVNGRNYAPFSNRCLIRNEWIGPRRSGRLEGRFSAQFGYIHIWKSGGTSIQIICDRHFRINWTMPDASHIQHFDRDLYFSHNLHEMFLVSFIRDPIQRFLSSYFEVHKRMYLKETELEKHMKSLRHLDNDELSPIANMRQWIEAMHMHAQTFGRHDRDSKGIHSGPFRPWSPELALFGDVHLYPQMYFLRWKQWRPFPMDYIGDLDLDLADFMQQASRYFGHNSNVSRQDIEGHHARDRHAQHYSSGYLRYAIERQLLHETDIQQICDIYWLDYLCLPIPIPEPCNLTAMFERHYGKHVIYKNCNETYKNKLITDY